MDHGFHKSGESLFQVQSLNSKHSLHLYFFKTVVSSNPNFKKCVVTVVKLVPLECCHNVQLKRLVTTVKVLHGTGPDYLRWGVPNPWNTAHYQATAHLELGHGSGGKAHTHAAPFAWAVSACAHHAYKLNCAHMLTVYPCRTISSPPPASPQSWNGWGPLI